MIYKIGNTSDLSNIPIPNKDAEEPLRFYADILTETYGESRDLDKEDGGFILYVTPNTPCKEIKAQFDYTQHLVEFVDVWGEVCSAVYILSQDYGVVIVVSIKDAPAEILKEIENEKENNQ